MAVIAFESIPGQDPRVGELPADGVLSQLGKLGGVTVRCSELLG